MTRLEGQNAKKVNNPIFNYSNVNCSQNRKQSRKMEAFGFFVNAK